MRKLIIRFSLFVCILGVIISAMIIIHVQQWSNQAEGELPAKTAVILHAVNNQLVQLDMKIPDFILRNTGQASLEKRDIFLPTRDGTDIQARIYQPVGKGPFPIIMYYHGGAFLEGYGNIETHENITRYLATKTKSIVISVGYRLAPEYVFPTAIEDSYDALIWASKEAETFNGDPTKIAVAGDSAGGNIATVVSQMARDRKGPSISAQILYYPITTFQSHEFASRLKYESGYYFLSRAVMEKARNLYTPDEAMWKNPYTSPLDAPSLADLPPAFLITAEFDPLRDEGEAYGRKLAAAGIAVEAYRYQGVMHGFISFYEVMYRGKHGLDASAQFIKRSFSEGIDHQRYLHKTVEMPFTTANLKDEAEAYAIAGILLGKQAFTRVIGNK